jgi:hypothetical protein
MTLNFEHTYLCPVRCRASPDAGAEEVREETGGSLTSMSTQVSNRPETSPVSGWELQEEEILTLRSSTAE